MLESLSFCGWMTQILIKILITVFLNSTIRLTAWLKTFLLKGASFYFARWLSKLVEGWHIFFVLVKMILIRLMASFTEVGLRYKLFFNPGTRKMLQGSKFSIHCMPLSKEYSLETREDNNSWRRRSGLTAMTCDTTSQHYLQFPRPPGIVMIFILTLFEWEDNWPIPPCGQQWASHWPELLSVSVVNK